MSAVEELKSILNDMRTEQEIEICAVISRNGIPLAYELPEGVHIDAFSTLSATILGASEVIYSGLRKKIPEHVLITSNGTNYIALGVGPKALLVAMSSMESEVLTSNVREAAEKIKEVLAYGK
ncbi:MAG: roadblock/LC7 domain-containing protein [Methanomassiliicoccales archaeon]|nr:MAG: roadblock/LC7 domain-containing protein [Methanomassiliicoccales archaeon]